MRRLRCGSRSGLTLLELLLALALLGIMGAKAFNVLQTVSDASDTVSSQVVVEDQALALLRRISYAIMGSSPDTLDPTAGAPLASKDIQYRLHLGLENGEVVWSDPEMIGLEVDDLQVFWTRNAAMADEQRVVWSNLVAPYLEGELPNGMDDNENGVIDERGLCFEVDGDSVTIRLTLEQADTEGELVTSTVRTTVTCRNLSGT